MDIINKYGLQIPEILLPKENEALYKWPVVACDQYTQDKNYWESIKDIICDDPSTLNLIYPEAYLKENDKKKRIEKIRNTMKYYLNTGVFRAPLYSMVYIERLTEYGRKRKGLIASIDLETYEWKPFSHAKIRSTEETIKERIPPRVEIRRGALLDVPHIMLLVNDPEKQLIEKTGKLARDIENKPLYDVSLLKNAGKLTGWHVPIVEKTKYNIKEALMRIEKENKDAQGHPFMFAVGDGNHSLATAKATWEEFKKENNVNDHPSRYALVEIVNLYDEGLTFEPIHRVVFNAEPQKLLEFTKQKLKGKIIECNSEKELKDRIESSKSSFGFVYTDKTTNDFQSFLCLETDIEDLAISKFQPILDSFLEKMQKIKKPNEKAIIEQDFIHGSDEVFRLGKKKNAIGILLPPIVKESFFSTIAQTGPLPRKSFSMGEASEKRFYMETRLLQ